MVKTSEHFQIAIDGPVAAGKSSVAKLVASELGFLYVDTGAMYRAVALKSKQECVQWSDEAGVISLLNTLNLELDKPKETENDGRLVTVLLDGEDVSNDIRSDLIAEGASIVSTYAGVRELLVALQQNIASGENVVMEGRDIGSTVLPNAQLKIYMDAKADVRARRKWKHLTRLGDEVSLEEVKQNMLKRDKREMTRKIDPLKPAKDSKRLDTTNMSVEDVVDMICGKVKAL